MIYLITGLPGTGKTTAAKKLQTILESQGLPTALFDGDHMRKCWPSLGYSEAEREVNQIRIHKVADALSSTGMYVIVATVAPKRIQRERYRRDKTVVGSGLCHIYFSDIYVKRAHMYPLYEEDNIPPNIHGADEFNWYLEKIQS